jgi:hypothetical protein
MTPKMWLFLSSSTLEFPKEAESCSQDPPNGRNLKGLTQFSNVRSKIFKIVTCQS